MKHENLFYRHATFPSSEKISKYLTDAGYGKFAYYQTLITVSETEAEITGRGKRQEGFVVVKSVVK